MLIMENMPSRCADCILRASPDPKNPFCVTNFKNISDDEYYKEKPDWCPLQEVPKKYEGWYLSDRAKGYNACVDEIERKRKNE